MTLKQIHKLHCKRLTWEFFIQMVKKHIYGHLNEPGVDKIIERSLKLSEKKLQQIRYVKMALRELKGRSLTARFMKQYIDQNIPDEYKMSTSKIRSILKYDL